MWVTEFVVVVVVVRGRVWSKKKKKAQMVQIWINLRNKRADGKKASHESFLSVRAMMP